MLQNVHRIRHRQYESHKNTSKTREFEGSVAPPMDIFDSLPVIYLNAMLRRVHLLMSNQKSALFHNTAYYVAVFIVVIASGISLPIGIGSNQPQITMAQQQQQQQQQQLQVNQT